MTTRTTAETLTVELRLLRAKGLNVRHLTEHGCSRRYDRAVAMLDDGARPAINRPDPARPDYWDCEAPSASEGGVSYRVTLDPLNRHGHYEWTCTCQDARNVHGYRRGACKHARMVGLLLLDDLRDAYRICADALREELESAA